MILCKLLLHAGYGLDVLGFISSNRRVLTMQFLLAQKLCSFCLRKIYAVFACAKTFLLQRGQLAERTSYFIFKSELRNRDGDQQMLPDGADAIQMNIKATVL